MQMREYLSVKVLTRLCCSCSLHMQFIVDISKCSVSSCCTYSHVLFCKSTEKCIKWVFYCACSSFLKDSPPKTSSIPLKMTEIIVLIADDENIFPPPSERSLHEVIIRPVDFISYKRMVPTKDDLDLTHTLRKLLSRVSYKYL